MNFGYAPNGNPKEEVHLEERDADNQYGIYLYRHVVSDINLRDLDVFEIGCSRGGGAEYSKRNLKPRTMVGVYFSEGAVAFCNQNYQI